MLKVLTIYGLCIMALSCGFNLRDMLRGNTFRQRLVNFIAVLMGMPMIYVFIKMLQLL